MFYRDRFSKQTRPNMKHMKIVGLAVGATFAVSALAAGLENVKHLRSAHLQSSKQEPQLVVVTSGKQVIAELKIMKPATLDVEAGDVVFRTVPGGGKTYSCTGGTKLELSVEGKSVLTVSGDSLQIDNLKTEFKSVVLK